MSDEETEDRPGGAGSVRTRAASARVDSQPATEPSRTDAEVLVQRMAGKPAGEVLARITNGDPLRLYPLCARRIRELYFVLDPDRVFELALAMVAVGIEIEPEHCAQAEWLTRTIDRAIERTLERDREEENAGVPAENPEEHFRLFVEALFVEPPLARLAAVRLNGLEERVRKAFQHLLIDGLPLEECLEMGLGPQEQLQLDILAALEAIGLIDEKGFEDPKAEDQA
jgi:hypothetical protein